MEKSLGLDRLERFHAALADTAVRYREPTGEELTQLASRASDDLREYWKTYGWCTFLNGLLWTVNPIEYERVIKNWPVKDALVIGRTGFGDLLTVVNDKLFTIFVHTGRYHESGRSFDATLSANFRNRSDLDDLYWGELYREAAISLGIPGATEIFTFEPALALGGAPEVKYVRRAAMEQALAFLARLHPSLQPLI
jgi:hypothetical protein